MTRENTLYCGEPGCGHRFSNHDPACKVFRCDCVKFIDMKKHAPWKYNYNSSFKQKKISPLLHKLGVVRPKDEVDNNGKKSNRANKTNNGQ